MQLESGDLLLFEPGWSEFKDTCATWLNGTKYARAGIVLKKNGIDYCVECIGRNPFQKFFIVQTMVSNLLKNYNGTIWRRRLMHPRDDNFDNKVKNAIDLAPIFNICDMDYTASFVAYIYTYLAILPPETNWASASMQDLQSRNQDETRPNLKFLWLYELTREMKVTYDNIS